MQAPTPPELDRFRAALSGIAPDWAASGTNIAVALSGGSDSLALLLLAAAAFPGRIAAATVDHGLRAASAAEAAQAARAAAALGVPHAILVPQPAEWRFDHGPQAAARDARYAALARWMADARLDLLLTAHHADDQAETVLMRLARGSGIAGLAGIRPRRGVHGRTLLRPLLGFTRGELMRITTRAGLEPVDDPSNADPRFDRTMARSLLARAEWLRPDRLAAVADHARDAETALDWAAQRLLDERVTARPDSNDAAICYALDPAGLPHELLRRLVREVLLHCEEMIRPGDPGDAAGPAVERLIETLHAGGSATLGRVLARGGPIWQFAEAPPRRGAKTG